MYLIGNRLVLLCYLVTLLLNEILTLSLLYLDVDDEDDHSPTTQNQSSRESN